MARVYLQAWPGPISSLKTGSGWAGTVWMLVKGAWVPCGHYWNKRRCDSTFVYVAYIVTTFVVGTTRTKSSMHMVVVH